MSSKVGRARTQRGVGWERVRAALWDVFAPQRCLVCGAFGAALHDACTSALPAAIGRRCERCWAPSPQRGAAAGAATSCARCALAPPAFSGLRTPFVYTGLARAAVLEAKFAGRSALLAPLGVAAARAVPPGGRSSRWPGCRCTLDGSARAGTTRPGCSRRRSRQRSSCRCSGRCAVRGARRRRRGSTPSGAARTSQARSQQRRSAAGCCSSTTSRRTGATLDAAARALLAAGAAQVFALAVARED